MINDMGNVELFELCETNPKEQCKECFRNQGIVYCTYGHLLKESEASRGILQWTLDLLPIQNYVVKGDLMAIDLEKLQNKKTIILPRNLHRIS